MSKVNARWSFAQRDIQQQHVRVKGIDLTPCLSNIDSRSHREAMLEEDVSQERRHERFVLDDEDAPAIYGHM